MKALVIALAMCTAVSAQSKGDLKKKYGEPVAETFVIRPGIVVTASHNSIGQITELVISPQLTEAKFDNLMLARNCVTKSSAPYVR